MEYRPYEYQKTAARWVMERMRCCLFLDMGLGKSVITLTAIQDLIDGCEIGSALVVAPKKVAETTWTQEARKWDHLRGLRIVPIIGTAKQRTAAMGTKADVHVIGRDSYVWLVNELKGRMPWDMLVIDELTSFKTPKSQRFKAMRMTTPQFDRVIGLTGTPAPNGLIDLWAQMYCIDMGERLGKSMSRYRDTYFEVYRHNNIIVRCTPKAGCDRIIRGKVADICLTMKAEDYLSLPEMMTHTVEVRLSPATERRYKEFERERVLEFAKEHEGGTIVASSIMALMNKLCQFANGAVYDDERNVHEIHGEKLAVLSEIVEAADGSVLVFHQFRHDAWRICEHLKGLRVETYEGAKQLEDWNAGRIDVLLAHPASTAFGLNMQQGGHTIVWFGTGWNLELYQQANARLHRQGQSKPVMVYRLIVPGTVDEMAAAAVDRKSRIQDALLEGLSELIKKHER